ncbi:HdeA/HdeB family chaperone [Xanthobacteraceae bacterium Astr-EGSB]|uniref:HdeA/HdeB family chaperone n=1 Tax=Astrobacterium formosum TaxID=3069710 RepID=UPI0027B6968F|nr:HdeA/HdeB family chaperone [Xanthobacteraceae bacterium Astr-EGSB]
MPVRRPRSGAKGRPVHHPCKDFFEGSQDRVSQVVMWPDGYYADEDDPPIVDFDRMKKRIEELAVFCAKNPALGLITAADETLAK